MDVTVRLASRPASVATARRVVTDALATIDADRGAVDDIRLAVSEACSNVVRHGPTEAGYEVQLHVHGDRCELVVRDGGEHLDAAELPDALPSAASPSGRGLLIMRAVMDEVDVEVDADRGTVVRMVKRLAPGN